jgi:hypothetical protein
MTDHTGQLEILYAFDRGDKKLPPCPKCIKGTISAKKRVFEDKRFAINFVCSSCDFWFEVVGKDT